MMNKKNIITPFMEQFYGLLHYEMENRVKFEHSLFQTPFRMKYLFLPFGMKYEIQLEMFATPFF